MSSITADQDDGLVQSVIDANTLAARLWFQDVKMFAAQGNPSASAIVDLNKTEEGQEVLWHLITNINHAISSCGYELPADDAKSSSQLRAIAQKHPEARWVIEQQIKNIPLSEINPELDKGALLRANERLMAWCLL